MYTVIYRSGQPLFMICIVSCSRLNSFRKVLARLLMYQHGEKKPCRQIWKKYTVFVFGSLIKQLLLFYISSSYVTPITGRRNRLISLN